MNRSSFIFHGPVNDFLDKEIRNKRIDYESPNRPSVKDAIESLGVPHPEVGLILINGKGTGFDDGVGEGDAVEVYSHFGQPPGFEEKRLPFMPEGRPAFILDVHLGRLARFLRVSGFDTFYQTDDPGDEAISGLAGKEGRIVLTCDVGLLKRSGVKWGHWLRNRNSREQFREVVGWYGLKKFFVPFSRCVSCNGVIIPVEKSQIIHRLKEGIRRDFDEFYICSDCEHIYWQGSHYRKICELLAGL